MHSVEGVIEAYLFKRMRQVGGGADKFVCPNHIGKPDRLCYFKHGLVVFVELKATGKALRSSQVREHTRMRAKGLLVELIDSKLGVDKFITKYMELDNAIKLCDIIARHKES